LTNNEEERIKILRDQLEKEKANYLKKERSLYLRKSPLVPKKGTSYFIVKDNNNAYNLRRSAEKYNQSISILEGEMFVLNKIKHRLSKTLNKEKELYSKLKLENSSNHIANVELDVLFY